MEVKVTLELGRYSVFLVTYGGVSCQVLLGRLIAGMCSVAPVLLQ